VDAALWFARAVRLYDRAGGPRDHIVDGLLPALLEIATAYRDGTGLGIRSDAGGLISAGDESLNATWMDARIDGVPVTPRHGQAVEINALWYHLVAYLELILAKLERKAESREWQTLRRTARRSFLDRFWLGEQRYLADVWRDGVRDTSVRPNMVIAAALEFSPLSRGKRTDIVQRTEVELLTERGLRTLSPKNEEYVGHYRGGTAERDGAYHQGTVWPWLFGFYVEAALRAFGPRPNVVKGLTKSWNSIADHVHHAGLGHVSEVFDGDAPHRPGGTFAQAWNTAELLRSWRLLEETKP
jgi:predicted glycogen debranching enzyme